MSIMDIIGLFKFKDKTPTTFVKNEDIKYHDFNQKIGLPCEEYGVSHEEYLKIIDTKENNEIMEHNRLALFVAEQLRTPPHLRKPDLPELKLKSTHSWTLTDQDILDGNKMALEYSRVMRVD